MIGDAQAEFDQGRYVDPGVVTAASIELFKLHQEIVKIRGLLGEVQTKDVVVATESVQTAASSSDRPSGTGIRFLAGTAIRSAQAPWRSEPRHSLVWHSTVRPRVSSRERSQ